MVVKVVMVTLPLIESDQLLYMGCSSRGNGRTQLGNKMANKEERVVQRWGILYC